MIGDTWAPFQGIHPIQETWFPGSTLSVTSIRRWPCPYTRMVMTIQGLGKVTRRTRLSPASVPKFFESVTLFTRQLRDLPLRPALISLTSGAATLGYTGHTERNNGRDQPSQPCRPDGRTLSGHRCAGPSPVRRRLPVWSLGIHAKDRQGRHGGCGIDWRRLPHPAHRIGITELASPNGTPPPTCPRPRSPRLPPPAAALLTTLVDHPC